MNNNKIISTSVKTDTTILNKDKLHKLTDWLIELKEENDELKREIRLEGRVEKVDYHNKLSNSPKKAQLDFKVFQTQQQKKS